MVVNDFLYGEYNVDETFIDLIHAPAFQRLRWVALSNIPSVSYPMISGISRYAHSIGVFILADKTAKKMGLTEKDTKQLMVSALLHDAGMPPLGHLTEEALGDIDKSFDHEESLNIMLFNEGRLYSQMPDGEKIGITEALYKAKVDSKSIFETIKGKNELGNLIASKIDLDNIDNVIRLYRLIFNDNALGYCPQTLASNYFTGIESQKSEAYRTWSETRLKLYNKLMFSIPDFSQKATIKRITKSYFENEMKNRDINEIINEIRFMNDPQFLNLILDSIRNQNSYVAFNSGKFDKVINYGWINSIPKSKIIEIKKIFSKNNGNYYIDHIPDKRFKNSNTGRQSENGALLGLFSYGITNKKQNLDKTKLLHELIPEWEIGVLPRLETDKNSQLGLI